MNHPFYFCINCQLRIPAGQEIEKSEGQWLCRSCEGTGSTVSVARPLIAAAAAGGTAVASPPKLKAVSTGKFKARPGARPDTVPAKTEEKIPWLAVGGGAGAVLVVFVVIMLTRGKTTPSQVAAAKTPAPQKQSDDESAAASTPKFTPLANNNELQRATQPVSNTLPTQSTDKASDAGRVIPPPIAVVEKTETDDPRAAFAQREWTRIQDLEKAGSLNGAELYKRLQEFVAKNGQTASGKAAAEHLKELPPPKAAPAPVVLAGAVPGTPEPTVTKIFFSSNFDDDKDKVNIVKGSRGTSVVYGPSGACLQALNLGAEGYFKSQIDFHIDPGVVVTEHTWMHFACRTEGTNRICIQTFTNDSSFLEKYIDEGKPEEWHWVTFKLSDYTKNIWQKPWNKTGWTFSGTVIYSPGPMFMIDNLSIGEGPLPQDP